MYALKIDLKKDVEIPEVSIQAMKKLDHFKDISKKIATLRQCLKECDVFINKIKNGDKAMQLPSVHGFTVGDDNAILHDYFIKQRQRNKERLIKLITEFNTL